MPDGIVHYPIVRLAEAEAPEWVVCDLCDQPFGRLHWHLMLDADHDESTDACTPCAHRFETQAVLVAALARDLPTYDVLTDSVA